MLNPVVSCKYGTFNYGLTGFAYRVLLDRICV